MEEIWKDVIEYETLYQISNLGRLKRLYKNRPERILKPIKGHLGYMFYGLAKKSKIKTFRIHRLVALHFVDNPNSYPEVNHIDGNKENYSASNLEWCIRSQNMKHAHSLGLIFTKEARDTISKLDEFRVNIIRKMRINGFTLNEISNISGVSICTISKVVNNKSWNPEENIK